MENIYASRILVGKPKEKRLLRIPRRMWGDNIKIDLKEIVQCGMDSSGLGQGPVTDPWENGNELSGSIKCWKVLE
jgi:hypothetical protein